MYKRTDPKFKLGSQDAAFLGIEHLSILAASSGPDNIPSVARALGCRLSTDHRELTLFFASAEAHDLLAHIRRNGVIAAVFSVPATHESLQLKGSHAKVKRIAKTDLRIVDSHRQAFVSHVEKLGYPRPLIEALVDCNPDQLMTVTFTPSAAFSQTPGPNAGQARGAVR